MQIKVNGFIGHLIMSECYLCITEVNFCVKDHLTSWQKFNCIQLRLIPVASGVLS